MTYATKADATEALTLADKLLRYPRVTADGEFPTCGKASGKSASLPVALVRANLDQADHLTGPERARLVELLDLADDADAAHEAPRLKRERDKRAAFDAIASDPEALIAALAPEPPAPVVEPEDDAETVETADAIAARFGVDRGAALSSARSVVAHKRAEQAAREQAAAEQAGAPE